MKPEFLKAVEVQEQITYGEKKFPIVYNPVQSTNFLQLQHYVETNSKSIIKELNEEGALFFRGFDIQSPNEMASVLNKLGLNSFEYIGGAAVRKLVIGSESRPTDSVEIFTTNEAPPQQPIPFHNELMQNANYPQYLSFYCYTEADEGGSTPLLNCVELYQYISQKHPDFLNKITDLGVRYIRVVGKEDNPNSPIGRGWKNIFKADTKQQAEGKIRANDYEFEWLNNEDNDCRLISKALPAFRVTRSGKKSFCNQMIAVFKGWIDNKNSPSKCLKFGDFSELPADVMEDIVSFSDKNRFTISWKEGDFVLIDNQMVAHSREPFTGRYRRIYASLLKGEKRIKQGAQLVLNSGDEMPSMGFGTWKIPKEVCSETVCDALKAGYKLLDCACDYGNEAEVGLGIKKAIDEKVIERKDIFITSKLWNTYHHPEHVRMACIKSLKDLGLEYFDLYLIHFPFSLKFVPFEERYPPEWLYDPKGKVPRMEEDPVPIIDTWKAMEALVDEGLVKNIGVCNFGSSLLRDLYNSARIKPSVLQIEIHPYFTQKNLIRYCRKNRIQVTSFSTLGGASYIELSIATKQEMLFEEPVVQELAKKYKKTEGQIILRWAVQQGLAIIPKTSKKERLKENSDLFSWNLEENDMNSIDKLNKNKRYNNPTIQCEKAWNFLTPFPIYE